MSTLAASFAGIDSVVDAAVQWLSGPPLQQTLDDIRNARGDGLDLPYPQTVIAADVDPKTLTKFPVLMVIGGDGTTTGDAQYSQEFNVAVLVVVFLNGDDPVVLSKQMQRYLLAVRTCIERIDTFFPVLPFRPSEIGTMSPDPTRGPVNDLPGRYLKAGTFDFTVPVQNDI